MLEEIKDSEIIDYIFDNYIEYTTYKSDNPDQDIDLSFFFNIDQLIISDRENIQIQIPIIQKEEDKSLDNFLGWGFYISTNRQIFGNKHDFKTYLKEQINRDISRAPFTINSKDWDTLKREQMEQMKQMEQMGQMEQMEQMGQMEQMRQDNFQDFVIFYIMLQNLCDNDINTSNKFALLICQNIFNMLLGIFQITLYNLLSFLPIILRNPTREYMITINHDIKTMELKCTFPIFLNDDEFIDIELQTNNNASLTLFIDIGNSNYSIKDFKLNIDVANTRKPVANPVANPVAAGPSRLQQLTSNLPTISIPNIPRPSNPDSYTIIPGAILGSAYLLSMPFILASFGGKTRRKIKNKFTQKYNKKSNYKKMKKYKKKSKKNI